MSRIGLRKRFRLAVGVAVVLSFAPGPGPGLGAGVSVAAPTPKKSSELCRRATDTFERIESFQHIKLVDDKLPAFDEIDSKLRELSESVKKLEGKAPVKLKADLRLAYALVEALRKQLPAIQQVATQARARRMQPSQKAKRDTRDRSLEELKGKFKPLADKAEQTKPAIERLLRFFSTECGLT